MNWLESLSIPLRYFVEPQQRTYWYSLVIAVFVASLVYVFDRESGKRKTVDGLIKFIFPKEVYFHKSAINDYLYFFSYAFLQLLIILPFFSVVVINVATVVEQQIDSLFPFQKNVLDGTRIPLAIFFTIAFGVFLDFAIFVVHYLQHRLPFLWQFHKVHHSAQVMTPITVYRMHPVDDILNYSFSGLFVGVLLGIFQYLFKSEVIIFNVAGTNLLFVSFYLFFYNFRHSHIWFGYGHYLSHVFISPAQHQIHHSSDRRHRDKNMGFIFAFWDYLFGTLYVPAARERLSFGINPEEDTKFQTFWSLYLMSFLNLAENFKASSLLKRGNLASILVFCTVVGGAVYFATPDQPTSLGNDTVFLEEMTWQEIREAVARGMTTVLIPTGGTEQNGPHLVLGKHNYIVRYTCGKIAEQLGKTLVAPTVTYVPEGNIEPPEGHMRFPGTLTVTDPLFGGVLESTARALKAHGFRAIAFVGDSGGNQSAQEEVADRLNRSWSGEGVHVINVGNYYFQNGQARFLMNEGYTAEQIGGHAGIRDTSELMAVFPQGVRTDRLADNTNTDFLQNGSDGDSTKATQSLGFTLLNLKIQSAVNQIGEALMQTASVP